MLSPRRTSDEPANSSSSARAFAGLIQYRKLQTRASSELLKCAQNLFVPFAMQRHRIMRRHLNGGQVCPREQAISFVQEIALDFLPVFIALEK